MATADISPAYVEALVILGTAGVVVPLARRWGISPVLGYLGAGALLGPLGLGALVDRLPALAWVTIKSVDDVRAIADLGVVFLLFVIGLELSYERLSTMRRLVAGLGGLQIVLSTVVISVLLMSAGLTPSVAMVLAACLSLSSTAIVIEVLSDQRRMTTVTGRASFSILLAQDLFVIPLLIFIPIFGGGEGGGSLAAELGFASLNVVAAVAAIILGGRFLLRPLYRMVASTQSTELFIAVTLFVVVGTGLVAAVAGLSMALGAFIAGLLLAETEYHRAVEATVDPFKGLLLGVFFFTVGMNIDIRQLIAAPVALVGCVVGLIALKAGIIAGLARVFRVGWPAAIETGLLLGPGGEFAFVGLGLAVASGVVAPATAGFALAVTTVSMVLIPVLAPLLRQFAARAMPAAADPELAARPENRSRHAVVVGYGRVGKVVCGLLKEHGVGFVASDNDPHAVGRDRRDGHNVYYGNATDPAFLEACGLSSAAAVIVTIHTPSIIDRVVAEVRRLRPDIIIVSRARDADHARHLYEIGVTDAVPETVEASLQLSEAALVELGVPIGSVIASIHQQRDVVRSELQAAARNAGRVETRAVRPATSSRSR